MILGRRRVGQNLIGDLAVIDRVVTLFHLHRGDRRHRLDAVDIHLGELLDEGQHGVEFTLQMGDLIILDRDPRKVDAKTIKDVAVLRTVIGGETVFERR